MSFLSRFKKPELPDDEKIDFPSKEQEPEKEEPGIDLSPQPEKAKRINKMVIYAVGVVLILLVVFTLRSCGGHSSKKQEIQTSANDIITETDLKKAESDNKNKTKPNVANKNNKLGNEKEQAGQEKNLSAGKDYYVDDNGNTRAVPKTSTRSSAPSRPSSSSSGSYSSAPSAPAPLTPYEKYQNDSKDAYYKRQLQEEQNAYKEEKQAQRSDIFFNMDDGKNKKSNSDRNRIGSHETAANSYYNDGILPDDESGYTGENHFQDDYIQVIGNGSKR